jgi:hypothetical protein
MSKVIQFIHPGVEHSIKSGTVWNSGNHKRKYLRVSGKYLSNFNNLPLFSDQIYFWGEWEAQANFSKIKNTIKNGPKYIFEPFFNLPASINAQNTDPFVFGNQYYYFICKQPHYTSLRNLVAGDIILFGSSKNKQFVLDTVFIIKNKLPYKFSELTEFRKKYNSTFSEVGLGPLENSAFVPQKEIIFQDSFCIPISCDDKTDNCPVSGVNDYYLYEAVMYEDREKFDGMFSYAPCLANQVGENGFARPIINLPNIITSVLNQGLKITETNSAKEIWKDVTNQVLSSNLEIMIENILPKQLST